MTKKDIPEKKKRNDDNDGDARAKKSRGILKPLKDETRHSVWAVIFFVVGIFLLLSAWGRAGRAGEFVFSFLQTSLGVGYFLLPPILFVLGIMFLRALRPELVASKAVGAALFFLSGLAVMAISFTGDTGGIAGKLLSMPFLYLFDAYASLLFLGALFIISLLLIFDTKLALHIPSFFSSFLFSIFNKKGNANVDTATEGAMMPVEEDEIPFDEIPAPENAGKEGASETQKAAGIPFGGKRNKISEEETFGAVLIPPHAQDHPYVPPPLSLLSGDKGKPQVGDIKANANIIKRTLQNFGITVEMDEISIGPSVTRYALKPAEGVKLSRIVGLQNDLGLALAAHPLRIEAPIPGKSQVGIEVPNSARSTVGLLGLMSAPEFKNSEKQLLFAIGKNVTGISFFADLAKLPHLLIAGATGSGKSVAIHAVITSLLYRNSPEMLRFIMVDPKRVELTLYNNIPHLLTPVITDPKKAILALKWAAKEMERRYDILEAEKVRDIASYHKNIVAPAHAKKIHEGNTAEESKLPETMPYIAVVIDELADIMATYPREMESGIVRLAQMSRAVGIHLIVSTQRPSVNVITGLIKANIPGRIALQVASQVDSRTILDMGGAEKLLGAGDMLYLSGERSQPERLQSAFVSENEVKRVTKFLADQNEGNLPDDLVLTGGGQNGENEGGSLADIISGASLERDAYDDELYEEAYQTIQKAGKASTSYLQRRLKVGYARAARLMDLLEERGVIGPSDGARPREVIGGGGEGFGRDESEAGKGY